MNTREEFQNWAVSQQVDAESFFIRGQGKIGIQMASDIEILMYLAYCKGANIDHDTMIADTKEYFDKEIPKVKDKLKAMFEQIFGTVPVAEHTEPNYPKDDEVKEVSADVVDFLAKLSERANKGTKH